MHHPNAHNEVRVDLHVHSCFSDAPYSWFLRSAKSAECYTSPKDLYETAIRRGMNLVTVTDHDTIEGALVLKDVADNTFISEEVSARFPEDGCVVHTIALNITEAQHAELQRLRRNVYELVSYLDQENIAHFLCHPLSQVNRRLTAGHLQRCFMMFHNLEIVNGTRDQVHEDCLRKITRGITPKLLEQWSEMHPQAPFLNRSGAYGFIGGSDDHGRLAIARAFTSYEGEPTGAGLAAALRAHTTSPRGQNARCEVLSHNVYGVLTGFLGQTGQLGRFLGTFMDAGAQPDDSVALSGCSTPNTLAMTAEQHMQVLEASGERIDWNELWDKGHTDAYQTKLLHALTQLLVKLHRTALGNLADATERLNIPEMTERIPDILKVMAISIPYLLGNRYHAHDRRSARRFTAELGFAPPTYRNPRVAVLTDTIDDVNGVAIGLRRLANTARQEQFDMRIIGLGSNDEWYIDHDNIVRIPSLLTRPLPMYPQMEIGIPHLNSLLNYLLNNDIDLIQCSTPGPMGVVGLLAGRLIGVPVVGQYHTDVPEYVTRLSGDPIFGSFVGGLVGMFYRAMDRVLVPSEAVAQRIKSLGVLEDKVSRVPRGVDLDLFRPQLRDPAVYQQFGVDGDVKVLYVGRISREKGLDVLVDAFCALSSKYPTARLILVGDGPYKETLRARVAERQNGQIVFAGEHTGHKLAQLYASCDIFVYPSETETFGNSVVEAQAAGVPVIVSNRGAANENVLDGVTGLVVDVQNTNDLRVAIDSMLGDSGQRRRMGKAANIFAQRYTMHQAARGTFREYTSFLNGDLGDKAARGHGHAHLTH